MLYPRIVKTMPVRRDELLDVAQRLFGRQGYDGTSVNQIIAELSISKGAFYHYFASKEDLLEALAARFATRTAAETARVLADPTMDAFSKLTAFLYGMRRHKLDDAAQLRATFEPLLRSENLRLYEKTQRAVVAVVLPILTRIIAEGVAEQTFDTPDPENAAETIMHMMAGTKDLLTEVYSAPDRDVLRQRIDQLHRRMRYLGTAIDRLLGLPEGSIELGDRETIETLACVFDPAPSAA